MIYFCFLYSPWIRVDSHEGRRVRRTWLVGWFSLSQPPIACAVLSLIQINYRWWQKASLRAPRSLTVFLIPQKKLLSSISESVLLTLPSYAFASHPVVSPYPNSGDNVWGVKMLKIVGSLVEVPLGWRPGDLRWYWWGFSVRWIPFDDYPARTWLCWLKQK